MALAVLVGAGIWLASELGLAPVAATSATAELRRALVWVFSGLALAYAVALWRTWPRTGLAIGGGAAGIAALAVLAVAGGTANPPLFAAALVAAAIALGSVNAAMLLGHWYLVTPKLSPAPLQRLIAVLIGALVVQGLLAAWALVLSDGAIADDATWLVGLRFGVGIVLPLAISIAALAATRATSLQATTGLLYIGLAMVMAGTIGAASLSYLAGTPI
jgi:hypothetical protein